MKLKSRYEGTAVFRDRAHAGNVLAEILAESGYGGSDTLVLAIPNGGVPVALPIAQRLLAEFDLLIVRKIPIPYNPEAGLGAVTSDGEVVLNESIVNSLGLSTSEVTALAADVLDEIRLRIKEYKGTAGAEPLPIKNKILLLVDDGLASGFTMLAAVQSVRKSAPEKIIVAVPTAPKSSVERLKPHVDAVICPNIRDTFYFAVADAYANWYDLDKSEVIDLLKSAGYYHG